MHRSIGEQYSSLVFAAFNGVGGVLFAFLMGRNYAAILVAYLPVFLIILGTFGIMVKKSTGDRMNAIQVMGGVVSETLYAIKVVASFGQEEAELQKFAKYSEESEKCGKAYQWRFSFMVAIMKFAIFSFYTFAFYIGVRFIAAEKKNPHTHEAYDS